MKLHENKELFKNAIDYVVQTNYYSTEIVIKDYYVSLALKMLYSKFDNLVFIGGTSLSKCFNIINRFSEDINLAATGPSRKSKQKVTENVVDYFISNWQYEVSYEKRRVASDFKPLHLEYPNDYPGMLSNQVRLELIAFVDPFPNISVEITPLVNEILEEDEIIQYDMLPFSVKTQEPYRTFIEKILLQKEIYKDYLNGILAPESSKKRARDFYDIHKIWEYYNREFPLTDIDKFIELRKNNRKNKTSINAAEFNEFSLFEQYNQQEIFKQLDIDKSKLSIRDLNTKDIANSLFQIDAYFK